MLAAYRGFAGPERFLLAVLGATTFFDGYDRGILDLALPQIRDTYGLSQSSASLWLAALYVGALPALFLGRRADQIGRRRLLLVSVAGYTIATGLTALAPTIGAYVACQLVARLFLNAETTVVWTLAAEELPAESRGFGFGVLAMNAALGVGFGAVPTGAVLEPLGVSWRWSTRSGSRHCCWWPSFGAASPRAGVSTRLGPPAGWPTPGAPSFDRRTGTGCSCWH